MTDLENKQVMAENLRFYLNMKNITQAELCTTLNIKPNTFSDWINAKTYPRIDKIELLANFFEVKKSDLIEKDYTPDLDIRRIIYIRSKMNEYEKAKMMKILEVSFDEYFSDLYIDEDTDE